MDDRERYEAYEQELRENENRQEDLSSLFEKLNVPTFMDAQDICALIKHLPTPLLIDTHIMNIYEQYIQAQNRGQLPEFIKHVYDDLVEVFEKEMDYAKHLAFIPKALEKVLGQEQTTVGKYQELFVVKNGCYVNFEQHHFHCLSAQEFFTQVLPQVQKESKFDCFEWFLNHENNDYNYEICHFITHSQTDRNNIGHVADNKIAYYLLLKETLMKSEVDPDMLLKDYVENHHKLRLKTTLSNELKQKDGQAKRKI